MTEQVLGAGVDRRAGGGAIKTVAQWQWGDAENAIKDWASLLADGMYAYPSGEKKHSDAETSKRSDGDGDVGAVQALRLDIVLSLVMACLPGSARARVEEAVKEIANPVRPRFREQGRIK